MILTRIKRILLGEPLSGQSAALDKLPKWKALALLSSDALSSVAYATEEILIPLAAISVAATSHSLPIALAITLLLLIVTISSRQTIETYPGGSGAYFVARENLGVMAGLIAGASLLIDYMLTVAVSVAAGVENIASALPFLLDHKESIGAIIIFILMLLNLRGARGLGNLLVFPTYFFIVSFLVMIVVGAWRALHGEATPAAPLMSDTSQELTLFIILRAFSSGCTALTGIEAISDSVSAFRIPSQRNASLTLMALCGILATLFMSFTWLAHAYGVMPHPGETTVSQLAHAIFGEGWGYFTVQAATALILLTAANVAYSDFPRLSSYLAHDRFLPRQLASVGDRLVFSNGIVGLSIFAILLIVIFEGRTHRLIPLYAIGVFISFTLSQAGMVRHHWKTRKAHWLRSIFFNSLGAVTTFAVLVVLTYTKFADGAWIVALLIPIMIFVFTRINRHYLRVGKELSLVGQTPTGPLQPIKHTVIVPISGIHRGVIEALRYALSISPDVRACYVEIDPETTERVKAEWQKWAHEVPFVVLKSPYRSVIRPLLEYVDDVEQTTHGEMITIIIPEFVTAKWWHQILHNQTAFMIRTALMFRRRKVVTSVRYHLKGT